MSEHLNNTKVQPEEHKTNTVVHQTPTKNLNTEHEKSNSSLYCFFTRSERNDIVADDDTEQKTPKKSPIPSRVTIIDVNKQGKSMSNKDHNSIVRSARPVVINKKINTTLSKLHRLPKSMMLLFK